MSNPESFAKFRQIPVITFERAAQGRYRQKLPRLVQPGPKGVNFIGKAQEKRRSGARRSVITNQAAKAVLAGRATAMVNHYSGARVFHGYLDFLKRE